MILDTSALLAILLNEPEAAMFARAILAETSIPDTGFVPGGVLDTG
jgi:uncharacterized protein with PIN domain